MEFRSINSSSAQLEVSAGLAKKKLNAKQAIKIGIGDGSS